MKIRWFRVFLLIFIIIILICLYGIFIGAKKLKINEFKIESNTITEEYNGLKIVHITDLHYGTSIKLKQLKKIIKQINKIKPDLILFTGDLVDYDLTNKQQKELIENFNKLEAKLGKYAVSGNHDHFYEKWNEFIEEIGFYNLNDNYVEIYQNTNKSIFLAGISDNIYSTKNVKDKSEIIFQHLNNENTKSHILKILLMHEADYIDKIDYNKFNIILSGHSHGGQIKFPLIGSLYTPIGAKKYKNEYYNLNGTELYTSSGLGTTIFPIRLFNRPSFNFYRLIKKWN